MREGQFNALVNQLRMVDCTAGHASGLPLPGCLQALPHSLMSYSTVVPSSVWMTVRRRLHSGQTWDARRVVASMA
jgi:hypothetical protein